MVSKHPLAPTCINSAYREVRIPLFRFVEDLLYNLYDKLTTNLAQLHNVSQVQSKAYNMSTCRRIATKRGSVVFRLSTCCVLVAVLYAANLIY